MVNSSGSGGFIGRQRELEQLAAAVTNLGEGRGGTLLVAGSSGMGASRLLDELEARVIDPRGLPVTRLRSDQLPAWRGAPYRPVRVALEGHLRTLAPARVAALVDPAAELLGPLFAGIPGVPTVDPRGADRSERRTERTLEALRALLGRLASDRPVALILEDLHEIDAATRHLVVFLARTAGHLPLLLIGTYQPDALTRTHPFRETLDAIESGPRNVTRVDVGPLGQTEVGALIEAHEGERPSAPLLLLVAERARGNPLIAEEVLAARRDLSGASLTAPLAQLILGRLGHRSAECRSVLRALAVAEGPLLPGELAAVIDAYETGQGRKPRRSPGRNRSGSGMLDGELAAGLQEAIRERFAVALPATPARAASVSSAASPAATATAAGSAIRVRHQLVAGALAADLLPDERRRMHAAVASALSTHPAEAARHWLAAYEPARARTAALLAAEAEESAGASADALEHLELAIELAVPATHGSDDASDPLDVALLRRASEAALAAGNPGRAAALTESTLGPAIPSGDRVATAAAWDRLGVFRWETGDREGALAAHARALEILPRSETLERARVLATIGQIRMLEGSFVEAERLATEALALAGASGPAGEAWLGHATCTLGVIDGWLGRPESAIARLEQALAIADAARAAGGRIPGAREPRLDPVHRGPARGRGPRLGGGDRRGGGSRPGGRARQPPARRGGGLAVHARAVARGASPGHARARMGARRHRVRACGGWVHHGRDGTLGGRGREPDARPPARGARSHRRHAVRRAHLPGRGIPRALAGRPGRRAPRGGRGLGSRTDDRGLGARGARPPAQLLGVAAEVAEAARDRRDLGTLAAIRARAERRPRRGRTDRRTFRR
jgi:tetratricopeptide (TPR) repeat protein